MASTSATVVQIPELGGRRQRRLGRHVNHDERNRGFPIAAHPQFDPSAPIVARSWRRSRSPLNQGNLRSCEGNAGIRMAAQAPNHPRKAYDERAARRLYSVATHIDPFPGAWNVDGSGQDTGTDTTSMLKALQQLGYITEYRWGFTTAEFRWALSYAGPGAIGIVWKTGMDNPGSSGEIRDQGDERGGHALCVDLIDPNVPGVAGGGIYGGWQSWDGYWPNGGRWIMSFGTWESLREQQAEVGIGLC